MKAKTATPGLAALALIAGLASGCHSGASEDRPLFPSGSGPGGGTPAAATGTASVVVTGLSNQPFAANCFSEATVTIHGLGLHRVGDPVDQFRSIATGRQSFNLLDLAGGV